MRSLEGLALVLELLEEGARVLDIGGGNLLHAKEFVSVGCEVEVVDRLGPPGELPDGVSYRVGEFGSMQYSVDVLRYRGREFDVVWGSHSLEHVRNVGDYLDQVVRSCREGGIIALTVPPFRSRVSGGHLSVWTGGLLLYNMVMSGIDCAEARVKRYGYNVSVVVEGFRDIRKELEGLDLVYDRGDLEELRRFLPVEVVNDRFEGEIEELNW